MVSIYLSWNRSPYLMPWINCICCARNICYGLNGKEAMLAHCQGKQARNQEVTGGWTTSNWCRCSPHGRWRYTFYSISFMLLKGRMVWASVIYSLNFRRWYILSLISEPRVVFTYVVFIIYWWRSLVSCGSKPSGLLLLIIWIKNWVVTVHVGIA